MSGRKEMGFAGNLAIGCLMDIVLIVGYACVAGKDRLASAMAYAILLAIPVVIIRVILHFNDLSDSIVTRFLGPVALVGALLLATFCPIDTTDADAVEDPEPAKAEQGGRAQGCAYLLPHGVHRQPRHG